MQYLIVQYIFSRENLRLTTKPIHEFVSYVHTQYRHHKCVITISYVWLFCVFMSVFVQIRPVFGKLQPFPAALYRAVFWSVHAGFVGIFVGKDRLIQGPFCHFILFYSILFHFILKTSSTVTLPVPASLCALRLIRSEYRTYQTYTYHTQVDWREGLWHRQIVERIQHVVQVIFLRQRHKRQHKNTQKHKTLDT